MDSSSCIWAKVLFDGRQFVPYKVRFMHVQFGAQGCPISIADLDEIPAT